MTHSITLEYLDDLLARAGAEVSASEMHGIQVGMICIGSSLLDSNNKIEQSWIRMLEEFIGCQHPSKELTNTLIKVNDNILSQLKGINFNLEILLPDQDISLIQRILALNYWCKGFLSGLALAGITETFLAKHEVVQEVVEDLTDILNVQMPEVEDESLEEEEQSYVELVEYIKVAVQNIHIELKLTDKATVLH